ncbi:MAG: hypothetical protein IK073_07895 [Paludibacteraceae bacterium]|nr:hypothetical protein [Paludibacteraceae bacterium]
MKKIVLSMMALVMSVAAFAETEFAYDAGFDLVSTYVWRGQYNGALSFQPTLAVGFNSWDEKIQFRVGAWGSVGASDYKFEKGGTYFVPEVDVYATLNILGLTLGATHYYYFDGTPYFSGLNDAGGSQTEVTFGYDLGTFTPVNLYFSWNTMVAGADANLSGKRAYSTYIELGYRQELPLDMSLDFQVGMTPWRGMYTDYDNGWKNGFALTNVAVRFNKEWQLEHATLDLYAQASVNPYDINKNNVYIWDTGDNKVGGQQKLNGVIGLGVWF